MNAKDTLSNVLANCVGCDLNCPRIHSERKSGVPPRGFGYPERLEPIELLYVLFNPHKMDPVFHDRSDGAVFRSAFKRGLSDLATVVNNHTWKALGSWPNAVHEGLRELTEAVFKQPFQVSKRFVAITNLVKCECIDEARKPGVTVQRICAEQHLSKEIEVVQPRILVAMMSGIEQRLAEITDSVPIVSCHHPGKYNRNRGLWNSQYVGRKAREISRYL